MSGKDIISIKELRELCPNVTPMTLHRDLEALQREGAIVKIRGGARVFSHTNDSSFLSRERENVAAKELIASKSLSLIRDGMSVFFDAGTTSLFIIRALPDIALNIFTTGANFAPDLQRLNNASITLCCGNLNRSNMALSGQSTLDFLEKINIDLGFIGVSGYTDDNGFTCGKESEMLVKKLVIQKARTPAAIMDSSKLAKIMPYTFASLPDFEYVVCDAMPEAFLSLARGRKVTVL
jgi:DeoR family transcriptional regulator of aga operon